MSEESQGNNWMGASERGCGVVGLAFGIVLLVGACLVGLVMMDGIESSRANRAQARAAAEEAQASARSAEARAEVDKRAIDAERDVQMQVDRLAHELAMLRQQQENWEHTYSLALLAVSHLDEDQLADLEAQLNPKEAHSPWWWSAVAAVCAALVFVLGLLGWRLWREWRPRWLE